MARTFQKHTRIISLRSLQSLVKKMHLLQHALKKLKLRPHESERERQRHGPGKLLMLTQPPLQHKSSEDVATCSCRAMAQGEKWFLKQCHRRRRRLSAEKAEGNARRRRGRAGRRLAASHP